MPIEAVEDDRPLFNVFIRACAREGLHLTDHLATETGEFIYVGRERLLLDSTKGDVRLLRLDAVLETFIAMYKERELWKLAKC